MALFSDMVRPDQHEEREEDANLPSAPTSCEVILTPEEERVVIEGLEDPSHPFYVGVQWHPEDMAREESSAALFGAFVDAARKYSEQKSVASSDAAHR